MGPDALTPGRFALGGPLRPSRSGASPSKHLPGRRPQPPPRPCKAARGLAGRRTPPPKPEREARTFHRPWRRRGGRGGGAGPGGARAARGADGGCATGEL